jgi:hypothetical protein
MLLRFSASFCAFSTPSQRPAFGHVFKRFVGTLRRSPPLDLSTERRILAQAQVSAQLPSAAIKPSGNQSEPVKATAYPLRCHGGAPTMKVRL